MSASFPALWALYVARLGDVMGKPSQREIAELAGVNQTTVSRWLKGEKIPTDAAQVAAFAQRCGRNPLEAFVAAGFISEEEAGRGIGAESMEFLEDIRHHAVLLQAERDVMDLIRDEMAAHVARGVPYPKSEAMRLFRESMRNALGDDWAASGEERDADAG